MRTQTKWYTETDDGRLLCQLCPRACRLKEGDRGFCFVRQNIDGQMSLETYGKSTGFCIDPIEKKPLSHFLPGTPVLSFGTAGCNLGCKFCQNWDISKSREVARLSDRALPHEIAAAARRTGCRSVAYTYNDPVIWAEYAIDTAQACRDLGIKSVAVTAGYITEQARGEFFGAMDAANIDLKSFDEDFYFKLTGSHLQPVLETIEYVCNETDCWVELTNLIIPGENDSPGEIERMCEWIHRTIGPNVPIHFTAFHPDFRMNDRGATGHETLVMAYETARRCGLNYAYVGNVHDVKRQSTFCHQCGNLLIERDWHCLGAYRLSGNTCSRCGTTIPGVFEDAPGDWGAKRQRVHIEPIDPPVVTLPQPSASPSKPPATDSSELQQSKMKTRDITELNTAQKATIVSAACQLVQAAVVGDSTEPGIATLGELAEMPIDGVFVTVKRGETLRGCCGQQGQSLRLGQALADSAARTARDPRMPPLSLAELPYLNLSVSLLGPLYPIGASGASREQAVQVGKHGLRIRQSVSGGLLLPQVAVEQGWNARQFLDAVCRKAGLPPGAWQSDDAQLMLFDGVCFDGDFEIDVETQRADWPLLSPPELDPLRDWVAANLRALQSGATPMYYAAGVGDAEVLGLVLSLRHPVAGFQQWLQLSLRETRPMQSSLYQMTEHAARWLAGQDADRAVVDVAVLDDCVHHGLVDQADVRGIDPERRAVIVTDGRRWAVCGGRDSAGELIERASGMETFRGATQLYSMRCSTTSDDLAVSVGPRGEEQFGTRPPAVCA